MLEPASICFFFFFQGTRIRRLSFLRSGRPQNGPEEEKEENGVNKKRTGRGRKKEKRVQKGGDKKERKRK